jgi:[calcium/calmodulin-dependent protein kinase] kinase
MCSINSIFSFFALGFVADPAERITLQAAAEHPWVAGSDGPVPEFICRCGFGRRKRNVIQEEVQ